MRSLGHEAENPIGGRPKRLAALSANLRDEATPETDVTPSDSRPPTLLSAHKRKHASEIIITISSDEEEPGPEMPPSKLTKGKKRVRTNATTNDGTTSIEKAPSSTLPQNEMGTVGLLKDVDVSDINGPRTAPRDNRTRDVDHFFTPAYNNSNGRKMRKCKKCSKASHPVSLVAEISTLRRHLESQHEAEYLQWAEANGFMPMLPKDAKQRMNKQSGSKQSRLDSHLQLEPTPLKPEKKASQPYSDKIFRKALVRWIVETDQPISVVENPHFKSMINAAFKCASAPK